MQDPDQFLDPFIDDDLARDGGFPEEQRVPYKPLCDPIQQRQKGSCVAASCQMILFDNGIERPEAYIRGIKVRDHLFVDAENGGYISDVPEVLQILGLLVPYRYEPSLTLEQLQAATAGGKAAIVSINTSPRNFHAIVVDSIEAGMVCVRDPLGDPYQVTVENFQRLWKGKSVICV